MARKKRKKKAAEPAPVEEVVDGPETDPDTAEDEAELTLESIQRAKEALDSKDAPREAAEPLYVGLPAFRSTKHVEAFQINELVALSGGVVRLIGDECMAVVDSAFIDHWRPQAGQYYVKAGERRFCMTAGGFEAEFTAA